MDRDSSVKNPAVESPAVENPATPDVGSRRGLEVAIALVLINGLALWNAWLHNPLIGYDAADHLRYAEALAEGRLVGPEDSHEFFSPPLPYVVPALAMAVLGLDLHAAAKCAQWFQWLLSIGLTLGLAMIARRGRGSGALAALVFLGLLPVYYKSFAFVRGEPYVAFFTVVIVGLVVSMSRPGGMTGGRATLLGVGMGLGALSRQWAILLFPAVLAWFVLAWHHAPADRRRILKAAVVAFAVTALVGGWFYVTLLARFGSITAFNRPQATASAASTVSFGIGRDALVGERSLFRRPVRPSFENQLLPILYAETWGDYWGYFVVYGIDRRDGAVLSGLALDRAMGQSGPPAWLDTNIVEMSRHLGRVNLVSLIPTAIGLLAFLAVMVTWSRSKRVQRAGHARAPAPAVTVAVAVERFVALGILTTLAGYLWFVRSYPSFGGGDTVKATYILQIFPLVALLVGGLARRIESRSRRGYWLLLGALCLIALHNLRVMISQYTFQSS